MLSFSMDISGEMSTSKRKTIEDYFFPSARKLPRSEDSAAPPESSENFPVNDEIASHSAFQTDNIDNDPDNSMELSLPRDDCSGENSPTASPTDAQPAGGNAVQTAHLLDVGRLLIEYGPKPTNIPDDLKMKLLKVNEYFPLKILIDKFLKGKIRFHILVSFELTSLFVYGRKQNTRNLVNFEKYSFL